MRKSYRTLLAAIVLAAISTTAGSIYFIRARREDAAQNSAPPELLSQVPAGALAVVYFDLDAVRQSRFYQDRPDHSRLTVPDRDYASFIEATGFDFEKDLDRAVI